MRPSTLTSFPVPVLATQPHSMTDPPPNFTVGSKFVLNFLVSTALFSKMILACPDEPLHTSSDSACGEYAEKAFYALPFHWAVLVQSVLDCGTMYNDTISSKMFLELFRGDLWFVCDYSNHSSSLPFIYLSWPTTSFLHKDCSCGFPFSYYISDCGDRHLKPF